MNLKFTFHFEEKIMDRNIDIDHIKRAIREPDFRYLFEGRYVVVKNVVDKKIKVIYSKVDFSKRKNEYVIISAWYI